MCTPPAVRAPVTSVVEGESEAVAESDQSECGVGVLNMAVRAVFTAVVELTAKLRTNIGWYSRNTIHPKKSSKKAKTFA